MLTQHRLGIVVLLLLVDIGTSVNAGGCFVPDTTWDANTSQGITNVTSKVIFYAQLIAIGTSLARLAVRFPEA